MPRSLKPLFRGFFFGILLAGVYSGHAAVRALCNSVDCPPCGPSFCIDVEGARAAKAAKKAAAIRRGLPERLAKAFDELPDCIGCVRQTPDWPHIVVEMDPDGWQRVEHRPPPYTWQSQPWTRDEEQWARDMMRKGLVKSIHITLARYPCRCCPPLADDRAGWYPISETYWKDQPGWIDRLDIHEKAVVWEANDPKDLGPDPEDLTNISDQDKRPPVDLEMCGQGPAPVAREIHIVCEACRGLKEQHDQLSRWIADAETRLRARRRGVCILNQVIRGVWRELEATGELAQTEATSAQHDKLMEELGVRHEDLARDESEIAKLEAEIRDMEARRQAIVAQVIECEANMCRQPPPTEVTLAGPPEECTGPSCDAPCAGSACEAACPAGVCEVPSACTGDACGEGPGACTGPGCDVAAACTGDACGEGPDACTGDDCPSPADACTGGECNVPAECTGDDCPTPTEVCTGDQCEAAPAAAAPFRIVSGDMNDDGVVDEADTALFVQKWTQLNVGPARDVDGDGDFDVNDAEVIAREHPTDQDGDGDVDQDDRDAISYKLGGMAPLYPAPAPTVAAGGQAAQDDEGIPTAVEQPALPTAEVFNRPLPGDGNGDGTVDQSDYNLWRNNFGATGAGAASGDYNGNGIIDASDYVVWREHFGQTGGDGAQAVTGAGAPGNLLGGEIPILVTAIDFEGNPVTGTFFLPVDGVGPDATVPITIEVQTVPAGFNQEYHATATFSMPIGGDQPVEFDYTQGATWSTSNAPIASVSNADPSAGSDSWATLVINALDVDGNAITEIIDLPVDGGQLPVGVEMQVTVIALLSDGTPIDVTLTPIEVVPSPTEPRYPMDLTQVSAWSSSAPGIAAVGNTDETEVVLQKGRPLEYVATGRFSGEAGAGLVLPTLSWDPFLTDRSVTPGVQDFGGEIDADVQAATPGPEPAPGGGDAFLDGGPFLYVESLGGSTGEIFKVTIVNPTPEPLSLHGFVALEPVAVSPKDAPKIAEQVKRAPGAHVTVNANGYCLDFHKLAPPAGVLFRVAGADKQRAFQPLARVLDAAKKVRDAGLLTPDSDPTSYFHSIRQWALWTVQERFDRGKFLDAFVEHTRKNFAEAGQKWSDEVAAAVRHYGEGRWDAVQKVLETAGQSGQGGT